MSVHKVPQNVEAEDKLLGPFTFKQFIFLMITAFTILVAFLLSRITPWLIIPVLPFILFFGILGFYHREDQPVETYLLAAVNFVFKPKRRLWGSEGLVDQVKLLATPPKEQPQTKVLASERGHLEKLAHIMDTRGWAVKRPELNEAPPAEELTAEGRLVMPAPVAQEVIDIHHSDDLMDPVNYAEADKYTQLAKDSVTNARNEAISKMKAAAKEPPKIQNVRPAAPTNEETKIKVAPVVEALQKLAQNNSLPISAVARHAQKIVDAAMPLKQGIEIDLPN